jgi:hypothetical protein
MSPAPKPNYQKTYYERNRDEIKERMRERYYKKQHDLHEAMKDDEELREKVRASYRKKYYRRSAAIAKEQIKHWLESEEVKEEVKTFLKGILASDAHTILTPKLLNTLDALLYATPGATETA